MYYICAYPQSYYNYYPTTIIILLQLSSYYNYYYYCKLLGGAAVVCLFKRGRVLWRELKEVCYNYTCFTVQVSMVYCLSNSHLSHNMLQDLNLITVIIGGESSFGHKAVLQISN